MSEHVTDAMQQFGSPAGAKKHSGAGLVLLYTEGFKQLPAAWPLARAGATEIGSAETADLRLTVPAVSRRHADIHRDGAGYAIQDHQSTNGTFVDGCRITEARLQAGQELRIGDAIFKFVESDVLAYGNYRLDGTLTSGSRRLANEKSPCIGGYQMDQIAARVERLASSSMSLLLLGETGTGKEVLARALHTKSRRKGAFIGVNCGAITPTLLESELFGHKRGAFSGADRDKTGLIRAAERGTLLLDEIGDMPAEAQVRLLRVLQDRTVLPVGASQAEPIDVRVLGATHRDLVKLQEDERFRPDLYARLNEDQLTLPPLRERKEDIYLLLQTFFQRHAQRSFEVTFPFMMAVLHYDWPGNVRELESCAKRCAHWADGDTIGDELLPDNIREAMENYGLARHTQTETKGQPPAPTEQELIALLKRHNGNIAAMSRELGKAAMQTRRWLTRHNLDPAKYRDPENRN